MGGRFEGCIVYFYDADGNMLASTTIRKHNRDENSIEVSKLPELLDISRCGLFILSSPKPYACSGVVHPGLSYLTIKLYRGKETENRGSTRYNISGKALITAYIDEKKRFELHRPIEVELVNISTNGVRFRARYNTLSKRDRFNLHFIIVENLKSLTAEVVNLRDFEGDSSEYGCVLVGEANE